MYRVVVTIIHLVAIILKMYYDIKSWKQYPPIHGSVVPATPEEEEAAVREFAARQGIKLPEPEVKSGDTVVVYTDEPVQPDLTATPEPGRYTDAPPATPPTGRGRHKA